MIRFSSAHILLACIAVSISLVSRTSSAETPRSNSLARQQVIRLERDWSEAEIKHDSAALERILDSHFVCTFGAGDVVGKAEFIKLILGEEMLSQDPSDATVVVDRNVAVIVDIFTVRGMDDGKSYTRIYRITATYIRRHGRWVALAEQVASRVP